MGLILDTSVAIKAERAGQTPLLLLQDIVSRFGDQPVGLTSIAYMELLHGLYRATTLERAGVRRIFLQDLINLTPVQEFTASAAEVAGRIGAQQSMKGIGIPPLDLMIGATALALGFSLLTTNLRHFRLIPGLTVIPF